MMNGIDIRAILLATLAVFGIDFVSSLALFAVFGGQLANGSEEQVRRVAAALAKNPGYLRAALVLGTASTVVGGFLVARIARRIPYFNALAYGLLGIVLSLLWTRGESPAWFTVVGIGLTVPAALLGAYFAKRPVGK
jgi:CBS domain containing-hemolysin-like protein